ncbi:MAG: hypothetical protein R3E89_11960 [Thiolinea sp.]
MLALLLSSACMTSLGLMPKPETARHCILGSSGDGGVSGCAGQYPVHAAGQTLERTNMTMVFSTWREMSELLTLLAITLITLVLPFRSYYLFLGASLLGAALMATRLPKRL